MSVNGFSVVQVVLLGGAHIVFAIGAWFVAMPLLLLFDSTRKLVLFFQPASQISTTVSPLFLKRQKYLFWAVVLLSVLGFIFGVVFVGTGGHMRGAHQVCFYLFRVCFLGGNLDGGIHVLTCS